ncbi:MAG: RHS repeat protein [Alphaproteobacteria bacterium]|nr:RHS repeat protein [Alphaproteobacteria bacterium]
MKNKGLFLTLVGLSLLMTQAALADNEVYDDNDRLISYTDNGLTYSYAYDAWGYVYETVSEGGAVTERNYYDGWGAVENNEPQGTFTESSSNGETTRTVTVDEGDDYGWTMSSVFNSSGQNISMSYEDSYSYSSSTETVVLNSDGTWTDTYKTYYYEGDGDNRYISTVNEYNDQITIDQDQNWNNVSSTYNHTEYYEGGQQVAYSESGSATYDEYGNETSFNAKGLGYDENGQVVFAGQESSNGVNFFGPVEYENGQPVVYVSGGNYNNDFNRGCPDGSGWSGCQYSSAYRLDSNFDLASSQITVTDSDGNFIWKQEISEKDGVMTYAEYNTEDATTPSTKYVTYLDTDGLVTENLDPETGTVISTSLEGRTDDGTYVLNYDENGQLKSFEKDGRLYSLNSQGKLNMFQSCMECVR